MMHNTINLDLSRPQKQQQKPAPKPSKAAIAKQERAEALKNQRLEMVGVAEAVYVMAADGLSGVVIYTNKAGAACACGFRRRGVRPVFNYRYAGVEERETNVGEWLKGIEQRTEQKRIADEENRKPHTLAVGDVLSSSWGWEQTNIDFYEVVAVRGSVVDVVELLQDRQIHNQMQGTCTPRKGCPKGDVIKGKRPNGSNCIRISSFESASPWSGRPLHWSSYA